MRTKRETNLIEAARAVMSAMDRRMELERNKSGKSTAEFLAAANAVNEARAKFNELAEDAEHGEECGACGDIKPAHVSGCQRANA